MEQDSGLADSVVHLARGLGVTVGARADKTCLIAASAAQVAVSDLRIDERGDVASPGWLLPLRGLPVDPRLVSGTVDPNFIPVTITDKMMRAVLSAGKVKHDVFSWSCVPEGTWAAAGGAIDREPPRAIMLPATQEYIMINVHDVAVPVKHRSHKLLTAECLVVHNCKTTKKNIDELFLCTSYLRKDSSSAASVAAARTANDSSTEQQHPRYSTGDGAVLGANYKTCRKKYCISCLRVSLTCTRPTCIASDPLSSASNFLFWPRTSLLIGGSHCTFCGFVICQRLYPHEMMTLRGAHSDEWTCPSCLNRCSCAGCKRKASALTEGMSLQRGGSTVKEMKTVAAAGADKEGDRFNGKDGSFAKAAPPPNRKRIHSGVDDDEGTHVGCSSRGERSLQRRVRRKARCRSSAQHIAMEDRGSNQEQEKEQEHEIEINEVAEAREAEDEYQHCSEKIPSRSVAYRQLCYQQEPQAHLQQQQLQQHHQLQPLQQLPVLPRRPYSDFVIHAQQLAATSPAPVAPPFHDPDQTVQRAALRSTYRVPLALYMQISHVLHGGFCNEIHFQQAVSLAAGGAATAAAAAGADQLVQLPQEWEQLLMEKQRYLLQQQHMTNMLLQQIQWRKQRHVLLQPQTHAARNCLQRQQHASPQQTTLYQPQLQQQHAAGQQPATDFYSHGQQYSAAMDKK
jgi:hypothetical protein